MAGTSLSLENEHLAYLLAAEWGSIKGNLGKDDLLLASLLVTLHHLSFFIIIMVEWNLYKLCYIGCQ